MIPNEQHANHDVSFHGICAVDDIFGLILTVLTGFGFILFNGFICDANLYIGMWGFIGGALWVKFLTTKVPFRVGTYTHEYKNDFVFSIKLKTFLFTLFFGPWAIAMFLICAAVVFFKNLFIGNDNLNPPEKKSFRDRFNV